MMNDECRTVKKWEEYEKWKEYEKYEDPPSTHFVRHSPDIGTKAEHPAPPSDWRQPRPNACLTVGRMR